MDNSPFVKLPSELRILIWTFALRQNGPFEVKPSMITPSQISSKGTNPMALTQTCQKINEESQSLFYKTNTFLIRGNHTAYILTHLKKFTEIIGPENTAALRGLVLDIGTFHLSSFEEVFSAFREWTIFLTRLKHMTLTSRGDAGAAGNARLGCELVARATFAFIYPQGDPSEYVFEVEFARIEQSWEENMEAIEKLMVADMRYWMRLRPMFEGVRENLRLVEG